MIFFNVKNNDIMLYTPGIKDIRLKARKRSNVERFVRVP
jgi:hypothetical protein